MFFGVIGGNPAPAAPKIKPNKMIENIKILYKQLENRIEFISELAPVVKKSVHTIQNHWFAGFWKVPTEHQEVIVTMLQNKIKLQNDRKEVTGEN